VASSETQEVYAVEMSWSISMTDHAPAAKMKKRTVFGPHPDQLFQSEITFFATPQIAATTTSGTSFRQAAVTCLGKKRTVFYPQSSAKNTAV
jgi:hypothetical protein